MASYELVYQLSNDSPHSQLFAAIIVQALKDSDSDYFKSSLFLTHALLAGIDPAHVRLLINERGNNAGSL